MYVLITNYYYNIGIVYRHMWYIVWIIIIWASNLCGSKRPSIALLHATCLHACQSFPINAIADLNNIFGCGAVPIYTSESPVDARQIVGESLQMRIPLLTCISFTKVFPCWRFGRGFCALRAKHQMLCSMAPVDMAFSWYKYYIFQSAINFVSALMAYRCLEYTWW